MHTYQKLRKQYASFRIFFLNRYTSLYARAGIVLALSISIFVGLSLYTTDSWAILGATIIFLAILPIIFLLLTIMTTLERVRRSLVFDDTQMQCLAKLYWDIKPRVSLPVFRNSALGVDTCVMFTRVVRQNSPSVIVELGSGSSTVLGGYLREQGLCENLISVEHDSIWAENTSMMLAEHELQSLVDLRVAPLEKVELSGVEYEWYCQDSLEDIVFIDLLMIDGPPDQMGLGARFPGLEILGGRVRPGGYIIVDDCIANRWKELVVTWARENGFTILPQYNNEKGTMLLRRPLVGRTAENG